MKWPTKNLSENEWFAVKNGQKISSWPANDSYLQLYYQNKLKAVYQYDGLSNYGALVMYLITNDYDRINSFTLSDIRF